MDKNKDLEKMIESGELSTMTECAYGEAIADTEYENTLKKKIKKINETDKTE